jgi:uncharacterized membrane protein
MNKSEFIKILSNNLRNIPMNEKKEIISDYEEHFAIGLKEGKKEEEICESLGNPKLIAKQYKVDMMLKEAEKSKSITGIIKAIIASLSLGFFNIVFILGPYMGLVAVLISLFAAAFSITVSGIFMFIAILIQPLVSSFFYIGINPIIVLFFSIGTTALGLLFLIGDFFLAKYFYIGTIKYLQFNLKIIKK